MTRFGQCAITTRSDSARALPSLPRLPYAITRESVSLHSRYQSSVTPIAPRTCPRENRTTLLQSKMPLDINTEQHRQLTISPLLLFRCFGSRDPTQFSNCPRASQYILYPKQCRIAQEADARAVSRKFVPVQGIIHKPILEKRSYFIVHALRSSHRS